MTYDLSQALNTPRPPFQQSLVSHLSSPICGAPGGPDPLLLVPGSPGFDAWNTGHSLKCRIHTVPSPQAHPHCLYYSVNFQVRSSAPPPKSQSPFPLALQYVYPPLPGQGPGSLPPLLVPTPPLIFQGNPYKKAITQYHHPA